MNDNKKSKRGSVWKAFFHLWEENLSEPDNPFPIPEKKPNPIFPLISPSSPSFPGDPQDTSDRPKEPPNFRRLAYFF
jgi:hypothetical protein